MDNTLDEWVRQAQAGDAAALDHVLAMVRPLAVRRCAKLLPYRQDAEEAAQDALLTVATKINSYSGRGSFEGWVTVIASNAARQTYRRMRRSFVEMHPSEGMEAVDPRRTSVIAGSRLDLLDAIETLEADHPEAVEPFILRDLGGLTYDEIATLTAAPLGTVKARIHTARTYMRGKFSSPDDNF